MLKPQVDNALVTARQAQAMLGMSRSTFYDVVAAGKLPKPIKFGPRTSRWRLSEIETFIAEAEARSRGDKAA